MAFNINTARLVEDQELQTTTGDQQPSGFDLSTAQPLEQPVAPPSAQAQLAAPIPAQPRQSTVSRFASEIAGGVNQGVIDLLDFVSTDQFNAISSLVGSDVRIPSIESTRFGQMATARPQESTTVGNVLRAAGEVIPAAVTGGGLIRSAAQKLPALGAGAESVGAGVVRQLGTGTAAGDVALGGISGAGGEIGEDIGGQEGELVGAILAPLGVVAAKSALTGLFNLGRRGIEAFTRSTANLSDEGASTLLAEAMVRENLSPDDVAKRLADLGPEALPADIGNNFARLLRSASNQIPRIEGRAAEVLGVRQAGQGERILRSLDDATGTSSLTVDDEIARLDTVLRPQTNQLYALARSKSDDIFKGPKPVKGLTPPKKTKLQRLISGQGVAGTKAKSKADLEIKAKTLSGEEVTSLDIIDATKRGLDDEIGAAIRKGEKNKSRSLVMLKNSLLKEADTAIPEYKQARSLFAGKIELENAADIGGQFFKLKPREIVGLTKSMGESEKKMFSLGAKQAILDKIDNLSTNADAVRRLFSKNGDVAKLKSLFPDDKVFNTFNDTLKRESEFVLTRRAAQANSTTAKQLSDVGAAREALNAARESISSPLGTASAIGRIVGGLSAKKSDEIFIQSLEEAGDILLEKGISPQKIEAVLRSGSKKRIETLLNNSLIKELRSPRIAPVASAVVSQRESQ